MNIITAIIIYIIVIYILYLFKPKIMFESNDRSNESIDNDVINYPMICILLSVMLGCYVQ